MKQRHMDQIAAAAKAVQGKLASDGINNFYFVACGGSQAFMMPIQYMFDREIAIPSFIYTSNEFNYAAPKGFDAHSVVITCSHSGTTPETVEAARRATAAGALSIALSNEEGSPLWDACQYPVHYDHGPEAVMCDKNNAILYALAFSILKVVAPDRADRWDGGIRAIESLGEMSDKAVELYKERAVEWAEANKRDSFVYTMGSGASYGEMYSLAICFFMEMQWINSNCIHSGEYFHGPFEVTDYDIPFVITLGNGCTRHLDERALAFARKYSKRLFVIDENDFDLSAVDESLREYFAPIVETAVVRYMIDALAHDRGHDLSTRRYMWQMEY